MKVTFNINFHTVWGQKLCVVGSIPELGSWEPALAKEMSYKGDGNWQLELEVTSPVKDIEYRYFLSVNDRQIFEEWERTIRYSLSVRQINIRYMIIGRFVLPIWPFIPLHLLKVCLHIRVIRMNGW